MKLWPKLLIVFISVMLVGSSIVYANITIKTPSGTTVGYASDNVYIKNSNGKLWTATAANLQSAIWDLNSSEGGTVYVPEGVIYVDKMIWFNDDYVEIIGSGEASYLSLDANLEATSKVNGTSTADTASRVKIRNLNFVNHGTYTGIFLKVAFTSMIDIVDCEFQSSVSEAIYMDTVWSPDIDGNYFKWCGDKTTKKPCINFTESAADKSTAITIENNLFEYNDYCDIWNDDTNAYRCHILNNYFEHTNRPSTYHIYWKGAYPLIDGNRFTSSTANVTCLYLASQNPRIVNNHFYKYDLTIDVQCNEGVVSNNHFYECHQGIIVTEGTVSGNQFYGTGNASAAGKTAITAYNHCTIVGNRIIGGTNSLIGIQINMDDNIVSSNIIDEDGGSINIGIQLGANADDCQVYGNNIEDCTTGVSDGGAAGDNHVWMNFIDATMQNGSVVIV